MLNKIQRFARAVWQRLPVRMKIGAARAIQPKFTVSATGIIINDKDEVLLLEHVLRPASGWALPGGFLKPLEQPEAALRREMMEEIGLELTHVMPYLARTSRTHVEIFFAAKPAGEPQVKSREIIGFKWCKPGRLPADMSHTQQRLIREVLQDRS
jgi:ADP-ribose pyrophosphatase YjhB (NUDIX family)